MRTRSAVLAACLLGLATPATTASAAELHPTPAPVTLPAPVSSTAYVTLLGADGGRVAVARNGGQVLSGTTGVLAGHGARYRDPDHALNRARPLSDVTGTTLRFFEQRPGDDATWYLTTSDLLTGAAGTSATTEHPVAFAPGGWIGRAGSRVVLHRAGQADRTLADDVVADSQIHADADAAGVLLSYLTTVAGARTQRLLLWTPGATRVLADTNLEGPGARAITAVDLTPHTAVWLSSAAAGSSPLIHRWARSGGAVGEPEMLPGGLPFATEIAGLAATDDQVAVEFATNNRQVSMLLGTLQVLTAGVWREISLPDTYPIAHGVFFTYLGGLRADGDTFVVALGGKLAGDAGVYRVGAGAATRVATLPPRPDTISDVTLSAGRLGYGQRAAGAPAEADVTLVDRTVSTGPGGGLRIGDEVQNPGFHLIHAYDGSAAAVSYSAGRGAVRSQLDDVFRDQFVALDGPAAAGLAFAGAGDHPVKASGPYTLADRTIYRGTAAVLDLADAKDVDVFGSRVVWSTPSGAVRTRDLTSDAAPVTLATTGTGSVAVWGTTVAWAAGGGTIAVRTLSSSLIRVVNDAGTVTDLALTEGALRWADGGGQIWLVNTRSARSRPVNSGLHAPAQADDHLIAGLDASGRLRVQGLPFGSDTTFRPRLIGSVVAPAFSAATETWEPQFDASKPLTQVTLQVRRSTGALVRTLTGTADHGSIRDLVWNGLASNGTQAPRGTYTWTLTAVARDGDGSLSTPEGGNGISGKVTVR